MLQFVYYSKKLCNHYVKAVLEWFRRFIGELVDWHVVEDGESVKCFCCILRYTMRVGWGGSKLEHTLLTV